MKKTFTLLSILLIFLSLFILIQCKPGWYARLILFLNQDTIYVGSGVMLRGWIWNDDGGIIVGETSEGSIFFLNQEEWSRVEKDILLPYVRALL